MNVLHFVVFVSGLIQVICSPDADAEPEADHDGFGYDENDPLSPEHWRDKYKSCAGKYQSPIDIEESLVTKVSLAPLNTTGFDTPPLRFNITNNGHTVMITFEYQQNLTLSGGPLTSPEYKFEQFHFHWGPNDAMGSEDLINNHSYPLELHVVFYNSDYASLKDALGNTDGLVVLAYFFEISPKDNPVYSPIVEALPNIRSVKSNYSSNNTFTLASLLPKNHDHYFSYIGSLTTPPCTEGVRWIDFKHPIQLSHKQIEEFRKIRTSAGYLIRNFRPVQPLSNRPVWYNTGPSVDPESPKGGSSRNQISLILLACCIFMVPIIRF